MIFFLENGKILDIHSTPGVQLLLIQAVTIIFLFMERLFLCARMCVCECVCVCVYARERLLL